MRSAPLDPDRLPDDAGDGTLAAYVGEDLGRTLAVRAAALVAVVAVVAGAMSGSASPAVRTACLAAGGLGLLVLPLAQLLRWRRSRQWVAILAVLLVCGGLLASVFVTSRA